MKKNEKTNAQVEMGAMESVENAVLSFSAMNKAFGAVFGETMKFKQALRVFDGMATLKVPISKTKTMRFDEILRTIGVEYKSGRLDAKSVMAAWNIKTEDGYMAIYKNVIGYESAYSEEKPRKVYTWSEERKEYVGVSVVKVVAVEKWNARTILRGLLQTAHRARFEKAQEDSLKAWKEFDGDLFVFDKVQDKGGVHNKAKKIRKTQVEF